MQNRNREVRDTGSSVVDGFSIVQGGPMYRFQVFMRMATPGRPQVLRRMLYLVLLTWLPLLIFSWIQGVAVGGRVTIPFLHDYIVNVRLLVTLPILIAAEIVIDPKLRHAAKHFVNSGLVLPAEIAAYEEVIRKTEKLRDATWLAVVAAVVAFGPSIWLGGEDILSGRSTWHVIPSTPVPTLSLAGWWFALISVSLYRLWLFRWVWLLGLWTVFLWRVSQLRLNCLAINPDYAAGLAFLAHTQRVFGLITLSGSMVMAAGFANDIRYEGANFSQLKFVVIAFCILIVLAVSAPLLVLTPKLIEVKNEGMREYGILGSVYAQRFHSKWIGASAEQKEDILNVPDSSSLCDYCSDYAVVRGMQVVLINKEILLALAIPAAFPMILLVAIFSPSKELFAALLKLLM
jgi:hypothetical protein